MFDTVRGLVLREARYKEADKILTILTAERGLLTVKARGALRKSSHLAACTQPLCCADYTLFENRGRLSINEAVPVEQFMGLRTDLANFALAEYFAEVLMTVCAEEMPAPDAMPLALNTMYALANSLYTPEHIKSVFELRLLCLEGFQPQVDVCSVCGRTDVVQPMFSRESGIILCRDCAVGIPDSLVPLSDAVLAAMRHIVFASSKRIFSFSLPQQDARRLSAVCEGFVYSQLDCGFHTLEYWKSVK